MSWNKKDATARIQDAIAQTDSVDVQDLTSVGQLASIGLAQAWRVDAAHAYVEILNAPALLETTATESERSHKRLLRFLHVYQRVAHLVFSGTTARPVDYQNQRLHFLVPEPFGDEQMRIATAVAVADALGQVLRGGNDLHTELPDAKIRVGIDSGTALAVQNGTRGDREPLFLGNPANLAAKLLAGKKEGIYLTDAARRRLNSEWGGADPLATPLTRAQIDACVAHAGLKLDIPALIKRWEAEVKDTPLATFDFTRPKPPLAKLDLDLLAPANSRRIETAVIYADVDGFTRFVAERVTGRWGEAAAVQALHVIRKELRDVLAGFDGLKIRYNGDCLVGVLAEGATETQHAQTMSRAALCAAAMRSSFLLIQELLPDTAGLGLGIGLDAGPVAITRLGPKNDRSRCIVGRAVVEAEAIQQRCTGKETGLAAEGHSWANEGVRSLLPANVPTKGITYNEVYATLNGRQDPVAVSASPILSIRPKAYGEGR